MRIRTSFRLGEECLRQLTELAKREDRSRTNLVERAVRDYHTRHTLELKVSNATDPIEAFMRARPAHHYLYQVTAHPNPSEGAISFEDEHEVLQVPDDKEVTFDPKRVCLKIDTIDRHRNWCLRRELYSWEPSPLVGKRVVAGLCSIGEWCWGDKLKVCQDLGYEIVGAVLPEIPLLANRISERLLDDPAPAGCEVVDCALDPEKYLAVLDDSLLASAVSRIAAEIEAEEEA